MKKSKEVYEDSRCSLCGDSFSILSFGIMASSMCSEMVPRMTPDQMVKRLGSAPGSSAHPEVQVPMSRWLCYGGNTEAQFTEKEMVQQLGLSVNHTGCDVRIVTGEAMGQKAPSHASVKFLWWQWGQLFNIKWGSSSHINYLEMKMIPLEIKVRLKDKQALASS